MIYSDVIMMMHLSNPPWDCYQSPSLVPPSILPWRLSFIRFCDGSSSYYILQQFFRDSSVCAQVMFNVVLFFGCWPSSTLELLTCSWQWRKIMCKRMRCACSDRKIDFHSIQHFSLSPPKKHHHQSPSLSKVVIGRSFDVIILMQCCFRKFSKPQK